MFARWQEERRVLLFINLTLGSPVRYNAVCRYRRRIGF